jgi:protein phosphatase
MLRAHGITDKGRVRPTNEDCFAIDEGMHLVVVADGMGGHNAGEVASRTAVDAIVAYVGHAQNGGDEWPFGFDPSKSRASNVLRTAVHVANAKVFDLACATPDYAGMGTTIVAMLIRDDKVSVAHAGDSRLYLVSNGQLRLLTEDDTWVASVLAKDPNTDPGILRQHPMRHALTNVVGSRPRTSVHVTELPLRGGERFALTTDGVHGVLEESQLAGVVETTGDAKRAAAALVDSALNGGSRDNCTAVVADYEQG